MSEETEENVVFSIMWNFFYVGILGKKPLRKIVNENLKTLYKLNLKLVSQSSRARASLFVSFRHDFSLHYICILFFLSQNVAS